ncbi:MULTISPECIES: hypothetical protein [unclassified Bradyrhizobium]|uniref:hypothetical protein n=1 Tax=unclassified Bradyrhizobium TaxID=2631580 RepID=UPI0028EE3DF7|nr:MULTISPECIES: hypothetical protein [unclassified Bradyrhizobium]
MIFDAIGHLAIGQLPAAGNSVLSASFGSFTESGQGVVFSISLPDTVASYILTGYAANLSPSLTATTVSFAETGNAAPLAVSINAVSAPYVLSGQSVTFSGSGAALGNGIFALSGQSIVFATQIAVLGTSYALTGFDTHYNRDHINWVWSVGPSGAWSASGLPSSTWTPAGLPSTTWSNDPAQQISPPEVH